MQNDLPAIEKVYRLSDAVTNDEICDYFMATFGIGRGMAMRQIKGDEDDA